MICKCLCKSRKKCSYFYYLPNICQTQDFSLVWTVYIEDLCATYLTVIAFMVKDVMVLKGIFSIFPLAGLVKFMVLLQICHWISKQVFYSTEILFFVLIPSYFCFRATYVSRSIELNFVLQNPVHALESRMY